MAFQQTFFTSMLIVSDAGHQGCYHQLGNVYFGAEELMVSKNCLD
jgi:hypothetical protein